MKHTEEKELDIGIKNENEKFIVKKIFRRTKVDEKVLDLSTNTTKLDTITS